MVHRAMLSVILLQAGDIVMIYSILLTAEL